MTDPLVLVIGATGQLGSAVVRKLLARCRKVRALVRPDSRVEHLKSLAVETVAGDLRDRGSLQRACQGADYVIATASAALPRKPSDRFGAVDRDGYRDLINAALQCGIRQFIYTSVATLAHEELVPLFRCKRETERYLISSGLPYTIVRAAAFMDVSFAMLGSDLPIRGAEAPSVERPFWFSRRFFQKVRTDVARGRANVPGDGSTRHSFIAIGDVAEYLVRAVGAPLARNRILEVGGPEALSSLQVVKIYEDLLARPVRPVHTPALVFGALRRALALVSPAASNLMGINYLSATEDGVVPAACETAAQFGIDLTTAEQFLRSKRKDLGREDD